jgi:hypothetical protein
MGSSGTHRAKPEDPRCATSPGPNRPTTPGRRSSGQRRLRRSDDRHLLASRAWFQVLFDGGSTIQLDMAMALSARPPGSRRLTADAAVGTPGNPGGHHELRPGILLCPRPVRPPSGLGAVPLPRRIGRRDDAADLRPRVRLFRRPVVPPSTPPIGTPTARPGKPSPDGQAVGIPSNATGCDPPRPSTGSSRPVRTGTWLRELAVRVIETGAERTGLARSPGAWAARRRGSGAAVCQPHTSPPLARAWGDVPICTPRSRLTRRPEVKSTTVRSPARRRG